MKNVVSSISYDSLWGHDGTWACNHSTVLVPDENDLSYKADKTDLIRLFNQLQTQLLDNKRAIVVLSDSQAEFAKKHEFDDLKKELLDSSLIKNEYDFIVKVGEKILERIKAQCSVERNAIRKEIEAFSKININGDLKTKLEPIEKKLSELISLVGQLDNKSETINQKWREVKVTYSDCQEIKTEIVNYKNSISMYRSEIIDLKNELQSCINKYNNAILQISELRLEIKNSMQIVANNQVHSILLSMGFWKRFKWLFLGRF